MSENISSPEQEPALSFGEVMGVPSFGEARRGIILEPPVDAPQGRVVQAAIIVHEGEETEELATPGTALVSSLAYLEGEVWPEDRIQRALARLSGLSHDDPKVIERVQALKALW